RVRPGRHRRSERPRRRLSPRRRPDEGCARRHGLRRKASRPRPRVRSGGGPLERAFVRLNGLGILAAAALLTGCGGAARHEGTARLWITRDRGARVLVTTTVPAGLTAMQALSREAKIETRYGGRFVQSIDGLGGSLSGEHDWFWFLNG